jgi:hypothetical protein
MTQLLKHYWVDRDNTSVFAISSSMWSRPRFGYVAPNIEGLEIVHRMADSNGVPFCLSTCPDDTTITEEDGLEILTQAEWDAEIATYDTAQETKRYVEVRSIRDKLLSETDWIVTKSLETGVALSSEFTTWRTALRDLPNGSEFPLTLPDAPVAVSVSNAEYLAQVTQIPMINDPNVVEEPEAELPGE